MINFLVVIYITMQIQEFLTIVGWAIVQILLIRHEAVAEFL